MTVGLAITRLEHTSEALRRHASKCSDGDQVRRLLAVAAVLDGASRRDAATWHGMDRQHLCDWVHRYNGEGIDGLKTRRNKGRAAVLNDDQKAELRALVITGPDPEKTGVVRWRCVDLRREVAERYNVTVHESTIGKWLGKMGLTRLQPRPVHPKKALEAEETFKKTSPIC
jgi:transposase